MSRIGAGAAVEEVKPSNNIYTVLVAVSLLIEIIGFVVLYMRHSEIFGAGKGLFS